MLSEERFAIILEDLKVKRAVTVTELSKQLKISESTIRRDLAALDEMGKLRKVHGGATAVEDEMTTFEETMAEKAMKNVEEKKAIARYAVSLINDDDFIYLDAGTTTGAMIDELVDTRAKFVTNGIDHARRLTQKGISVLLLGGQLKLATEAIVGQIAQESLSKYNFTKCFIGANGIHKEYGFTTPDTAEAMIKKEVLRRSFMKVVLADSSKFGQVSSVSFGMLSQACIVTNRLTDNTYDKYTVIREVKV